MEHLLDYDSSSSSSDCSPAKRHLPTNCKRHPVDDVHVLTCNEQNALLSNTSNNHGSAGSNSNCAEGSFDTNGEGDSCKRKEDRVNNTRKRPKLGTSCVPRVRIAGDPTNGSSDDECNNTNDSYLFERSNPHWEGRWAGHLFLPFPPLHLLDASDDTAGKKDLNGESTSDQDANSDGDTSDESDTEDVLIESRILLPAVRVLIRHWAGQLHESLQFQTRHASTTATSPISDDCNTSNSTEVTIIPHVPMTESIKRADTATSDPIQSSGTSPSNKLSLHVSLSRPIYLPAPSVDSFLQSISKSINAILSASNLHTNAKRNGRIFHLRPHEAAIFTNDQQNRSFLTIPISGQNAQWVKRVLLPPIDTAMKKFGLESYYSEVGENCVLHVSVASVKGNVVKVMADARNTLSEHHDHSTMRSIPLFPNKPDLTGDLKSIPVSIPIRLDNVCCQFGKVKGVSMKF